MSKPLWLRWTRVFATGGAIIGTGVLLYKYAVPSDDELISRFSPEVRAEYEHNRLLRQKEQEEVMKIARETSKSRDPIWKTGPIKSPFEKDGRNMDPKLVDAELFHRSEADEHKKKEIEEAQQQLQRADALAREKKSWWMFWK